MQAQFEGVALLLRAEGWFALTWLAPLVFVSCPATFPFPFPLLPSYRRLHDTCECPISGLPLTSGYPYNRRTNEAGSRGDKDARIIRDTAGLP